MSETIDHQLRERLAAVRERIAGALDRAGRGGVSVRIVAVTKTVPVPVIAAAARCGLTAFGENRVQEAREKVPALPPLEWHLVGHLQTNKVRPAVPLFSVFQSVDSLKLARKLAAELAAAGRVAEVYAQVNTSGEASKFGMAPEAAAAFFAEAGPLPGLRWAGLMTIGPLTGDERNVRGAFARLRELRDTLRGRFPALPLTELSMGMSDDFEWALREGATVVRLGRVLFGDRPPGVGE